MKFEVIDTHIEGSPTKDLTFARIDLRFDEEEDGERSDDLEWVAPTGAAKESHAWVPGA